MSNGDDETEDAPAEGDGENAEENTPAENPGEEETPEEDATDEERTGEESAEEESAGEESADEESTDETAGSEDVPATTVTAEELDERLDEAEAELEAAETEAALDGVEERLDGVESDIEQLPEPDEDDEEAEDPAEAVESRLSELRDGLADERGPYTEDVVEILEAGQATLTDSEWTDDGESEAIAAVDRFLEAVDDYIDRDIDVGTNLDSASTALGLVEDAVTDADLDPDADEDVIADLLAAAETLESELEDAEVWSDLTVQEQLDAEGFYDILTNENRKDFPPEWNAAKLHAREGNLDMVLYAFDKLGSEFMEEYFLDIFYHLGSDAQPAFEKMHEMAQKRNKGPIEVLGKIGDDRACETLHEFIEGDGDPALQKVTLRSLGAIGSAESVQPVANRLAAEDDEVRSVAARTLGLLGDTRAVDPLADVLEADDSDEVRASAAWALRQIGTETALAEAAAYTDDRAYLVQAEAEKAAGA